MACADSWFVCQHVYLCEVCQAVGSGSGSRVSSGSTVVAERILYVHGIGSIGGAERDLIALLSRLDRRSWHPAIACPGAGPLREIAIAQDVPAYPVNMPPWRKVSSLVSRYAAVRRLRRLLAEVQPSLVHVNDLWWVPHTVRAVAGLSYRLPIIAHVRQETQPRKVSQYALDRVDYVVAVSHQVEQGRPSALSRYRRHPQPAGRSHEPVPVEP